MQRYRPRRVPTSLPVSVATFTEDAPFVTTAANISSNGMFLNTHLDFDVGSIVVCTFNLPGSTRTCSFVTEVMRSRHAINTSLQGVSIDDSDGVGVTFLDMNTRGRQQIKEFIRNKKRFPSASDNNYFA